MLAAIVKTPAFLISVALLCAQPFVAPVAHADPPPWAHGKYNKEKGQDRAPRADAGISLDEAVNLAERRYRARVIRAETRESNGRRIHQLRLLSDDGRVWTVRIDAATGAEL